MLVGEAGATRFDVLWKLKDKYEACSRCVGELKSNVMKNKRNISIDYLHPTGLEKGYYWDVEYYHWLILRSRLIKCPIRILLFVS